jgi:hypothetical protein
VVRLGAEDANKCGRGVAIVGVRSFGGSFAGFASVKGQIVTILADGFRKKKRRNHLLFPQTGLLSGRSLDSL